jgi:hypothetical protein
MGQETPHWGVTSGLYRNIAPDSGAALHLRHRNRVGNARMLASGTMTCSLNGSARSREIGTPCSKVKRQAKIARLRTLPVWHWRLFVYLSSSIRCLRIIVGQRCSLDIAQRQTARMVVQVRTRRGLTRQELCGSRLDIVIAESSLGMKAALSSSHCDPVPLSPSRPTRPSIFEADPRQRTVRHGRSWRGPRHWCWHSGPQARGEAFRLGPGGARESTLKPVGAEPTRADKVSQGAPRCGGDPERCSSRSSWRRFGVRRRRSVSTSMRRRSAALQP